MEVFVTPPLNYLELSELGDNNFYILAQLYKNIQNIVSTLKRQKNKVDS